jgi:L-malate glycosyltransferase
MAKVPQVIGSVRNNGYWMTAKDRLVMKVVSCFAHRWQTNSRALWRLQERMCGNRVEILPNGTDLSRFAPAAEQERQHARRTLGLNQNGPICVSVANLFAIKDLKTLINSVVNLSEQFSSIQFVVVGDGPQREELQNLAIRLGQSDFVKFVGRQSNVRSFLAAADIGVLTSHSEGSSNSLLEYMAMGLPSVVSDIAPNRELVEGLFFTPGNARDLAGKLKLLLQDAELRSQLRLQYAQAVAEFSLERFTLRAESYYNRVASERGLN